jgi:5-methylcytosine-specific restriction endonuclease McrA
MTKRQEFTPRQKDEILQRNMKQFGFPVCEVEGCGAMCKRGQFQIDHIIPCWEGGTNDVSNGRVCCSACHSKKSAEEGRVTQAADRKGRKDRGIKTVKRKIPAHVDPWGKSLRRSS